ncbi:hypothetical protein BpHYR1_028071 [Brachionus plicatilis]|uniref:Uncharacterized protein n=1 Tax=Brachionus plicatilis TaxID=10195 RepID=A0A3M7R3J0_BRAPC|nr:hypothetical protein BpHYR1_028071 [Brachionus plicatilis]
MYFQGCTFSIERVKKESSYKDFRRIGSYLFHDQLVTKFVTKLVDTGLVTTLISEFSENVQIEIKKVLSGKKNPVECSDSGRFFEVIYYFDQYLIYNDNIYYIMLIFSKRSKLLYNSSTLK